MLQSNFNKLSILLIPIIRFINNKSKISSTCSNCNLNFYSSLNLLHKYHLLRIYQYKIHFSSPLWCQSIRSNKSILQFCSNLLDLHWLHRLSFNFHQINSVFKMILWWVINLVIIKSVYNKLNQRKWKKLNPTHF